MRIKSVIGAAICKSVIIGRVANNIANSLTHVCKTAKLLWYKKGGEGGSPIFKIDDFFPLNVAGVVWNANSCQEFKLYKLIHNSF